MGKGLRVFFCGVSGLGLPELVVRVESDPREWVRVGVGSHDDHVMLLIPLYLTGVISLFPFPHPLFPPHH